MTREVDVRLYDTKIGIWQDNANDPTFRAELYLGLIKLLRRRRWAVNLDPRILKNYPSISKDHRLAERGDLRASIEVHGRSIEIEFWAETWPIENRNGRRYDFNKRQRLEYLDRLRVDLETQRVLGWLAKRAAVTIRRGDERVSAGRGGMTAEAYIAADYAKSWHSDKTLGRPLCTQEYNSRSKDRSVIEHGATVWFADRKGRIGRGVAYYHINNMWWVVTNRHELHNLACHELHVRAPENLRIKRNARERRRRLEAALAAAIRASDFRRAETLKRVAFGAEPTYGIWSRKENAYYRSGYGGYTSDSISAGRYTLREATDEVLRVPHILSLVMPDGVHVQADELSQPRAA